MCVCVCVCVCVPTNHIRGGGKFVHQNILFKPEKLRAFYFWISRVLVYQQFCTQFSPKLLVAKYLHVAFQNKIETEWCKNVPLSHVFQSEGPAASVWMKGVGTGRMDQECCGVYTHETHCNGFSTILDYTLAIP